MIPDLQERGIYLLDVILGKGPPPSYVLTVIAGLPDTSLTVALATGGREYAGWGIDRHLAAETFDAINMNTAATGQWKNKPPTIPPFPRPKPKPAPAQGKRQVSIRDLHSRMASSMRGG